MKTSRMVLYWAIAIITTLIAWYLLAQDPGPGWPINLIHLLSRYRN